MKTCIEARRKHSKIARYRANYKPVFQGANPEQHRTSPGWRRPGNHLSRTVALVPQDIARTPDGVADGENSCRNGDFFMEFQSESGYVVFERPDGLLKTISHSMQNVSPKQWLGALCARLPGIGFRGFPYKPPVIPVREGTRHGGNTVTPHSGGAKPDRKPDPVPALCKGFDGFKESIRGDR